MKLNKENVMKVVFFLAALTSVLAVALICVFLFAGGVPAMAEIGLKDFIFGQKWKPGNGLYGIFPMIVGSICVTGVSLVCQSLFFVLYLWLPIVRQRSIVYVRRQLT